MAQKFRVAQLWIKSSAANTSGLKFENLNSSSPTGTGAALGVDAAGNIIVIPAGGGGANIYTADGTIGAALRTVEFETNQMLWRAYDNVGFSAGKHFPLTFEGNTDTALGIAFMEYTNGPAADGVIPNYGMVGYSGAGSLAGLPNPIVEGFGLYAGTRIGIHSELEVRLNSDLGEYYIHTTPPVNAAPTDVLTRNNSTGLIEKIDVASLLAMGGGSGGSSLVYGLYIPSGGTFPHNVKRGYGGTSTVTIRTADEDIIMIDGKKFHESGAFSVDFYDPLIGASSGVAASTGSFFVTAGGTTRVTNTNNNTKYVSGRDGSNIWGLAKYNALTGGTISTYIAAGTGGSPLTHLTVSPSGNRAMFIVSNGITFWNLYFVDTTTMTLIWSTTDSTIGSFIARFGYSINQVDHLLLISDTEFLSSNSNGGFGNTTRHSITGAGTWTNTTIAAGHYWQIEGEQLIIGQRSLSRSTNPTTRLRVVDTTAALTASSLAFITTYSGGGSASDRKLGYYDNNVYYGTDKVNYTLPVITGNTVIKVQNAGNDRLRIPF